MIVNSIVKECVEQHDDGKMYNVHLNPIYSTTTAMS